MSLMWWLRMDRLRDLTTHGFWCVIFRHIIHSFGVSPRRGRPFRLGGIQGRRYCVPGRAEVSRVRVLAEECFSLSRVARKLITILNAILRDRRPWQPLAA